MKAIAIGAALLSLTNACHSATAGADSAYPSRPVRIVAASIGTTTDLMARHVGQRLSEIWGKPVVIENRPGVAVGINAKAVVQATPDGYTLLMGEPGNLANVVALFEKPPYDPRTDLAPVTRVARAPLVLVSHPSLPVSNLRELIVYARQRPAKLSYGSSGTGGAGHVTVVLLTQIAGIDLVHIPYKGAVAAMLAVMAGEAQVAAAAASTAMPQIKGGKVKALVLTGTRRFPSLPEVATAAESGLPGFTSEVWFAMAAPAKTPAAVVTRLNRDVGTVLSARTTQEMFLAQGAEAWPSTPDELAQHIRSEIAKWSSVIRTAGVKLD